MCLRRRAAGIVTRRIADKAPPKSMLQSLQSGEAVFFGRETGGIWVPLMAGLLHLFQQSLGLGTLIELLTHVRSNSFYPLMEEVIPSDLFDFFDRFMLDGPGQQTSSAVARTLSPPSILSSLLHWRSCTNSCGGYGSFITSYSVNSGLLLLI